MSYSSTYPSSNSPYRNGGGPINGDNGTSSFGGPQYSSGEQGPNNVSRPLEHAPLRERSRSPAYGRYGRDRDRDRDMDRDRDHFRESSRGGGGPRGGGRYREDRGRGTPPTRSSEHEQWIQDRHQRERPSRTLFVRNIDFNCSDRELEARFSAYGTLRDFFSMLTRRGIAFITFFDLRDAQRAKEEINGTMFAGRPIDVHYSLPREDVTPDTKCDGSKNQGTLFIVFEDQRTAERVTDDEFGTYLRQFGDIANIDRLRGHPAQRFVEFYDSRSCVDAQRAIDRSTYQGSPMVAQFSWDKATKEAIIAGGTHKDRNSRFRGGRSRSRSPPGRHRREDPPSRGSGRRRSRSPPPSRGSRYSNSPDRSRHRGRSPPPSRGGPSAEEVQRMLLASTGGAAPGPGAPASFPMQPSAQNPLSGFAALGASLPGAAQAYGAYANPALAAMHPALTSAQPQQHSGQPQSQQQQQVAALAGINPQWYPMLGLGNQQAGNPLQLQSLLSVLSNAQQQSQQASPTVGGAPGASQAQTPPVSHPSTTAPMQQNAATAQLLSLMQGLHSQQPSQQSPTAASPAVPTLSIPGMHQQPQQQQQQQQQPLNQANTLQELLARYSGGAAQPQLQPAVSAPLQDQQQPQHQQQASSPPADPRFRGSAPPKQ